MTINVFVNTWGNYNENGANGGEWLSLPVDDDDLAETLGRIAGAMGDTDPEWFINDYENDLDIEFSEYDSIFKVNELAQELDDLDDDDSEKFKAILETQTRNPREALGYMNDFDFIEGVTIEDLAEEYIEDCCDIPENLKCYIDIERLARDMSFENYTEAENGVLIG